LSAPPESGCSADGVGLASDTRVSLHASDPGNTPVDTRLAQSRRTDIVDGVLYLENAPFVTGEILHIDGGQSAGR
jgi:NAD(P)-dependent dehydrogenase (short-subunit alcohol dehydrogenase family)